jgi:enoyl-CoA hydratase/carnithine racemase
MTEPAGYTTLAIDRRDEIDVLTLNRPDALNAMNTTMADELTEYLTGLHAREECRVVVLRGSGRAFCAGADLSSEAFAAPGPGRARRQMREQRRYSTVPRLMRGCPQPIVALVNGPACGIGFSLALAADVRIAAPEARMNAAYLRIGLGGCDAASGYLLPRLVGLSVASELLLTGRFIDATRAHAVGLVSDVVPQEALLDAGLALAAEMLRASPLGLRMTKETLNAAVDAPCLDAALTLEDRQQVILLETEDHREAVRAFKEKRLPAYGDR